MSNKDDDGIEFDPTQATDAGEDEISVQAAAEARVVTLRAVANKSKREDYAEEVRKEMDIVERGRKLMQGNLVSFPDVKKTVDGYQAISCDPNRIAGLEALFGDGETRPHINTFSGRLVDWKGEIIDDMYSMVPLMKAFQAMGLRQQPLKSIRDSLRDWGLQVKQNDLISQFQRMLPIWDGKKRAEEYLVKLFGCNDTELNRRFGLYFWISLYCRVNHPGCMAPMVLSLFGTQNAGKSYFSVLLCRVLMADDEATSVQLNMDSDKIGFLRDITGASIVANIGEMTGFTRADLNDIKQFITKTSDPMHQKFEGHYVQKRQWVSILDGNKYEGLQRDETGNRRFYPMFVGQVEDENGQPAWSPDFKVDFTGFAESVWQIMAEIKQWLLDNGGLDGYNRYADSVSAEVKAFSQSEMNSARGIIRDNLLEVYLVPALSKLDLLDAAIIDGRIKRGVWITSAALRTRIKMMSRGGEIKDNHLRTHMVSLGAEPTLVNNVRGYLFKDIMTEADYAKQIGKGANDDDIKIIAQFERQPDF